MTHPDLACRDLVELVTDHLEDALDEDTKRRFADHLSRCIDCTAYLDQIRSTVALLAETPAAPVDAQTRARLLTAFRQRSRPT